MKTLLIMASEEAATSVASRIGYALGYFVGTVESHLFETALVAILLAASVIYFVVRNRRKKQDWK